MDQKTSTESVRFAPLALALALLALLGLVAISAHAQVEETDDIAIAQKKTQPDARQDRNIFSEAGTDESEEVMVLDESDESQTIEKREEKQVLLEEEKTAFAEDRAKRLEAYRSFLEKKRNSITVRAKEHQEERRLRQTNYRAALSLSAQVRLGQYAERIVIRMDTALGRLEQIADRIATRIEKTEEKGVDLSDAKVELANVRVLIEDAHEYVSLIGEVSTETLTSETPKEQMQDIRDAVELAKDCINSIRGALTETVKLIRVGIETRVDEEVKEDDVEDDDESAVTSTESETTSDTQ
ncbi:TPA: hypothetical protein DEP58_01060 [Patescibacteria group bacterium]|nr:MAG: hypothetical protein UU98_C0041G0008 [Parcubacteria group bacterium GW2011_GWD2_42_14]HCC04879.1 hypothetical protein [Patescibacteria group bacterium]